MGAISHVVNQMISPCSEPISSSLVGEVCLEWGINYYTMNIYSLLKKKLSFNFIVNGMVKKWKGKRKGDAYQT